MMTVVAQILSDDDIADLAAYYASIQVSVTPPPG
jgi:cytochrome c553